MRPLLLLLKTGDFLTWTPRAAVGGGIRRRAGADRGVPGSDGAWRRRLCRPPPGHRFLQCLCRGQGSAGGAGRGCLRHCAPGRDGAGDLRRRHPALRLALSALLPAGGGAAGDAFLCPGPAAVAGGDTDAVSAVDPAAAGRQRRAGPGARPQLAAGGAGLHGRVRQSDPRPERLSHRRAVRLRPGADRQKAAAGGHRLRAALLQAAIFRRDFRWFCWHRGAGGCWRRLPSP